MEYGVMKALSLVVDEEVKFKGESPLRISRDKYNSRCCSWKQMQFTPWGVQEVYLLYLDSLREI